MYQSEIITTADGSGTIFIPVLKEQYHSVNGAVTESRHVYISNGLHCFCHKQELTILEVGFGTGLNALLTAEYAINNRIAVTYFGVEKYPLGSELLGKLDYGKYAGSEGAHLFRMIHESKWGEVTRIHSLFKLKKLQGDFLDYGWEEDIGPDLVYFDAFGPDKQPEMWTEEVFRRLSVHMAEGGILVTYSAKGEVRRRLKSAGFKTERLPGPPGKREMIRASILRDNAAKGTGAC